LLGHEGVLGKRRAVGAIAATTEPNGAPSSYDADEAVSQKEVDRLWQGAPSGAFESCVSAFGIHDMMGNVEEWVTSRKRRKHPGALVR
jgi:formylglycine-generating enzyme required for sulfatase activity